MPPARRPSVVLDTNVVVSGVLSRNGPPFEILHAWHARRFVLILTEHINREYHRVIAEAQSNRKLNLRGFDANLLLDLLMIDGVWVENDVAPIIRSRDPNDDHLLTAAMSGRADFLVSGDIDVLELAGDSRLSTLAIVSPRAFALELRNAR